MHGHRLAVVAAIGLGLSAPGTVAEGIELEPIQVGSGMISSYVQIEFFEGQTYLFEVFYSDLEMRSFDLLVTLDTELGEEFLFEYLGPPESAFVTGLGFDGFVDQGDGSGGDDWWRFWVRDSAEDLWASSFVGPSSRNVSNGSWDGWIFGRDDEPVEVKVIPAPPATLALAGLLIVGRRRRRAV